MVLVPHPDGGSFCIDSREVTNEQYAAFLARPAPAPHPECVGADHNPKANWPPPADRGPYPVGGVTWCDAHAFCTANGKRLCGDASGALIVFDKESDEELNARRTEMWAACTRGGTQAYAYGDEPEVGRCNDAAEPDAFEPAAAETRCEGGYDGIFFLQGNAFEWEGACQFASYGEGGPFASCMGRGHAGCDVAFTFNPTSGGAGPLDWSPRSGIRCCADALETP
jgi:hypothetical protein